MICWSLVSLTFAMPSIMCRVTEDFYLPRLLSDITGQTVVPFGDGVMVTMDTVFGCETCEELFTGKRYEDCYASILYRADFVSKHLGPTRSDFALVVL